MSSCDLGIFFVCLFRGVVDKVHACLIKLHLTLLYLRYCSRISQNKLTAVMKHFLQHGLTPREKKSGGRKYNSNAISAEDTERAVQLIRNFAEDHALVLPGRVPGFKRADVKILPSVHSRASIWRHYYRLAHCKGKQKSFLYTCALAHEKRC